MSSAASPAAGHAAVAGTAVDEEVHDEEGVPTPAAEQVRTVVLLVTENDLIKTKRKLEVTVPNFYGLLSAVAVELGLADAAIEVWKRNDGRDTVAHSLEDLGAKAKVEIRLAAGATTPVAEVADRFMDSLSAAQLSLIALADEVESPADPVVLREEEAEVGNASTDTPPVSPQTPLTQADTDDQGGTGSEDGAAALVPIEDGEEAKMMAARRRGRGGGGDKAASLVGPPQQLQPPSTPPHLRAASPPAAAEDDHDFVAPTRPESKSRSSSFASSLHDGLDSPKRRPPRSMSMSTVDRGTAHPFRSLAGRLKMTPKSGPTGAVVGSGEPGARIANKARDIGLELSLSESVVVAESYAESPGGVKFRTTVEKSPPLSPKMRPVKVTKMASLDLEDKHKHGSGGSELEPAVGLELVETAASPQPFMLLVSENGLIKTKQKLGEYMDVPHHTLNTTGIFDRLLVVTEQSADKARDVGLELSLSESVVVAESSAESPGRVKFWTTVEMSPPLSPKMRPAKVIKMSSLDLEDKHKHGSQSLSKSGATSKMHGFRRRRLETQ